MAKAARAWDLMLVFLLIIPYRASRLEVVVGSGVNASAPQGAIMDHFNACLCTNKCKINDFGWKQANGDPWCKITLKKVNNIECERGFKRHIIYTTGWLVDSSVRLCDPEENMEREREVAEALQRACDLLASDFGDWMTKFQACDKPGEKGRSLVRRLHLACGQMLDIQTVIENNLGEKELDQQKLDQCMEAMNLCSDGSLRQGRVFLPIAKVWQKCPALRAE